MKIEVFKKTLESILGEPVTSENILTVLGKLDKKGMIDQKKISYMIALVIQKILSDNDTTSSIL